MPSNDVDELNQIMLNLSRNLERVAIASIDGAHPESVRASWRRYFEDAESELVAWSDHRTAAVLERLKFSTSSKPVYQLIDDELTALTPKAGLEKQ